MTFQDLKQVFIISIGVILIICISIVGIYMILTIIDTTTIKEVGIERAKCIDKEGAEFEDEWCEKEIYCSWLGFAGDRKCNKK